MPCPTTATARLFDWRGPSASEPSLGRSSVADCLLANTGREKKDEQRPSSRLFIRKIRRRDGRSSNAGSDGKETAEGPEPQTKIRTCLAREVEVLRRCIDWLQRLERGETVVVNLRPETEVETEFVSFDRLRVVRVLERIAADLDDLIPLMQSA